MMLSFPRKLRLLNRSSTLSCQSQSANVFLCQEGILGETNEHVNIHNRWSDRVSLLLFASVASIYEICEVMEFLCDRTKALYLILDRFIKDEMEHLWHHPFCFEQIEGMSRFLDSLHYPLVTIESSTKQQYPTWNPKMTTLYVFGMQDQDQYACVSKQGSPVNCRALRQRRLCHRHRIPNISVVHGSNTNPFHLEWRFLNQLTNHDQLEICSCLRWYINIGT